MKFLCALHLLLLILCTTTVVIAQSTNATISGVVLDQSSRAIPDAEILILNDATGVRYPTTTNKEGLYTVSILPPGQYRVQVSKDGFKSIIKPGITLNVQSAVALNFTLPIGATSETVTVDSGTSQINTTDASVSTVIDRKFVENIPLNGRSFQDLILLTPGVVTNSPQSLGVSGATGEFSVNGQRTESNVYSVDGVNANTGGYVFGYGTPGTSGSLPAASALGTTQSLISVDALQEFRVESSTYSAEYGLSPGGQFSFTSRSGTNEPHGSLFDYLRNNYFDANDWFNDNLGQPQTALRQNDFGGTFGGPIRVPRLYDGRSKSFFFFSYEGLRLTQPQAALTYYVPSNSLRQSAPLALQAVLNAYPVPTGQVMSNGLAAFVQSDSVPSQLDSISIRLDHEIVPKLKAFFRFSETQSAAETQYLSNLSSTTQSSYTSTLGAMAQLSVRIANELRLNYTSSVGGTAASLENFGGSQQANLLQLQGLGPAAYAGFYLYFPGYVTGLDQFETSQPQHAWNVVDGLTLAYGRHVIRLGMSYRETASRLQQTSPYVYTEFDRSQAVAANTAALEGVEVYSSSYPAYTNTAAYVQDEIRVNRQTSLSLGLRWELNPPPTQTSGSLPYIAVGDIENPSSITLAPSGTRFWRTTYFNIAPRLGIAYQAQSRPGWETIIRSGGGVFFDTGQQASTQAFGNSPGQSADAFYTNASYPLTTSQLAVSITDPPLAPYFESYYFPTKMQLPYTFEWNFSVEQGLGKEQALTISYVGSNGRRLLSQQLLAPGASNPDFTYIFDNATGTTSSYNSLQVKLQRTLSRGLQMISSYSFAHALDFGSQNINFAQIRGNSDFDIRQNLSAGASYDIPADLSNKVLEYLSKEWSVDGRLSARTSFPVTLNGNEITEPNGQFAYTGLNVVPDMPLYVHTPGVAGDRRVNPAAFVLPAAGQNGNAPRNFVRGFGMTQIDFAVRRTFPFAELMKLQFRAEAFNILNHPNFGYIQPAYGNIQFGEATQMINQSLGNLSPLYQQGGPRSLQFALKILF